MRKLLAFLCICVQIVPSWGQSVLRTPKGVKVETGTTCMELECFSSSIIRVKKYPVGKTPDKQSLSVTMQPEKVKYKLQETKGEVILATSELVAIMDIAQKQVRFTDKDGKVLLLHSMMREILPIRFARLSCWIVMRPFMVWDNTSRGG